MKKILPLLVVVIFVLTGLGASAVPLYNVDTYLQWQQKEGGNILPNGDAVDQCQPDMDFFAPVGVFPLVPNVNYIIAQAFKPTKGLLTRVELMAGRNGTTTYDYTVAIRDDLMGPDLTAVSLPASEFIVENFSWVEFDFEDLTVTPGQTYYIVSYTVNETDNWYAWGAKLIDVYPNGTCFASMDDGMTWEEEVDADMTFMTYGRSNQAPNTPDITGQTNGNAGTEYEYTFVTTDPDDDELYYYIEWGDGETEEWIGPYASGEEVKVKHTWDTKGTYIIKAKAKDVYDAESDWGTLEVTMPKSRFVHHSLFLRLLERFPGAFPLFRHLIGL